MIAIRTTSADHGAGRLERFYRPVMGLAAAVLVMLAGAMVIDTVATVVRLHSALPYFDQWDDLALLRAILRGQTPLLSGLLAQNNEHRIAFPRLILFADDLAFGARGVLDAFAILVIQAAQATMLIALLRRVVPRGDPGFLPLAAVTIILLSSLRQEENFSWDFQVQFVAIFALATSTAMLFATAIDRVRQGLGAMGWLAAAALSAFVGTFTMANGLITALMLVFLAIAGRAGWRLVVSSLVLAAVLAALYLHGYTPQAAHTPLSQSLRHPLGVVSFAATYLGNFLYPHASWSRLLGLCGLAGMAAAAADVWRDRGRSAARLALLGVMLFTAGTAVVTALGRLGFGLDQAMSSRYSTGSAAFWSALLAYGWSTSARTARTAVLHGVCGAAAFVLVAGAIQSQRLMKTDAEQRADAQALATDGLLLGLKDTVTLGQVDDAVDAMLDVSAFLKERHWSVFGEPDARLAGQPLAAVGPSADRASCAGDIAGAVSEPRFGEDAVAVSGALSGRVTDASGRRLYLADPAGRIVGFASLLLASTPSGAWRGYAVAPPGTILRAFLRLPDGALCLIGEHAVDPAPPA